MLSGVFIKKALFQCHAQDDKSCKNKFVEHDCMIFQIKIVNLFSTSVRILSLISQLSVEETRVPQVLSASKLTTFLKLVSALIGFKPSR